jgi:hypothetical protein
MEECPSRLQRFVVRIHFNINNLKVTSNNHLKIFFVDYCVEYLEQENTKKMDEQFQSFLT